jgi:hypothetical protein
MMSEQPLFPVYYFYSVVVNNAFGCVKCELFYKELEDIVQNRNVEEVHTNHFMSKCSNLKCCHLDLLYMLDQNVCRCHTIHLT